MAEDDAPRQALATLTKRLRELEPTSRPAGAARISTGIERLDRLLPGRSLRRGTLVEWLVAGTGAGAATLALTVAARSDIDGDGIYNTWGFVKPAPNTGVGVPGPFGTCPVTGVFDPVTVAANRLNIIGPCDAASAANEY